MAVAPVSLIDTTRLGDLSDREASVLSLAAKGLTDRAIAARLGISTNTLRTYWARIRGKLGEGSRVALAAALIGQQKPSEVPLVGCEPASWEIDLLTWTYQCYDPHLLQFFNIEVGEIISLESILSRYHPEDAKQLRALLHYAKAGYVTSFAYRARIVTERGLTMASAYAALLPNPGGKPHRLCGRRIPILDVTHSPFDAISVGRYRRNFRTGEVWADAECKAIYRIPDDATDIREALLLRYHPDDVAAARTYMEEAIARRTASFTRTFRLVDDEERYHWVTSVVNISYDDDGPVGADVTVMAYG